MDINPIKYATRFEKIASELENEPEWAQNESDAKR